VAEPARRRALVNCILLCILKCFSLLCLKVMNQTCYYSKRRHLGRFWNGISSKERKPMEMNSFLMDDDVFASYDE
jgi:hypothetical protein